MTEQSKKILERCAEMAPVSCEFDCQATFIPIVEALLTENQRLVSALGQLKLHYGGEETNAGNYIEEALAAHAAAMLRISEGE